MTADYHIELYIVTSKASEAEEDQGHMDGLCESETQRNWHETEQDGGLLYNPIVSPADGRQEEEEEEEEEDTLSP